MAKRKQYTTDLKEVEWNVLELYVLRLLLE